MKRIKVSITLLCLIVLIISGCSKNDEPSQASILIYNHQEFVGKEIVSQDQYSNLCKVGVVSKKIINEQILSDKDYSNEELLANELSIGTEIFKLDESKLLAKMDDSNFKVFELLK